MRFSILLRLLITFSCIFVVLNSLITLLTWLFLRCKSCCCRAYILACCAYTRCFFIEDDLTFFALCSLDLLLRISRSWKLRSRLISKCYSFLFSIMDWCTIDRFSRCPSLALKFSSFCCWSKLFWSIEYRLIPFFSFSRMSRISMSLSARLFYSLILLRTLCSFRCRMLNRVSRDWSMREFSFLIRLAVTRELNRSLPVTLLLAI